MPPRSRPSGSGSSRSAEPSRPAGAVRSQPARSRLAQERSRDTRQAIIKAALELWSERGYDTGIDTTKAEEIAARAGVSKATFYLHFARKEDILLETGWATTTVFYDDAVAALGILAAPGGGVNLAGVLDYVTVRLCRRMDKVPREVLRRILRAQANSTLGPGQSAWEADSEHFGFQRGFALIFDRAQETGSLPRTVGAADLGGIFEAMLYSSLREWSHDEQASLLTMLRQRFAILLAGARAVSSEALSSDALSSSEGLPSSDALSSSEGLSSEALGRD